MSQYWMYDTATQADYAEEPPEPSTALSDEEAAAEAADEEAAYEAQDAALDAEMAHLLAVAELAGLVTTERSEDDAAEAERRALRWVR